MRLHLSKKLIILISAAILVLAAVGSTLAYIIAKTPSTEDEFTPTEVTCLVSGNFSDASSINATVQNTGNITAYMRAVIVVTYVSTENGNIYGVMPTPDVDYRINFGSGKWMRSQDGYYYYSDPVKASGVSDALISSIELIGTAPDGYKLSVQIAATAIQAEPLSVVKELWDVDILENGKLYVGQ